MSKQEISLEDGKYVLTLEDHKLTATRHGEPWQDFTGNKMMYLLVSRLLAAEEVKAPALEWDAALRVSEHPDVDDALRLFAEGETSEDQAVCLVQAVLKAAGVPALLHVMKEVLRISDREHDAWNKAKVLVENLGRLTAKPRVVGYKVWVGVGSRRHTEITYARKEDAEAQAGRISKANPEVLPVYDGLPSLAALPEIDYNALIQAAVTTQTKWAQGTTGCIAFARGAEWYRYQLIKAQHQELGE